MNEGDLLFTIEKSQYEAALSKAKADLASARADAALKAADEKRDKDLLQKAHVSEAAYEATLDQKEQAEAAVEASKAALQQAELNRLYRYQGPVPGPDRQDNLQRRRSRWTEHGCSSDANSSGPGLREFRGQ